MKVAPMDIAPALLSCHWNISNACGSSNGCRSNGLGLFGTRLTRGVAKLEANVEIFAKVSPRFEWYAIVFFHGISK